MWDYFLQTVDCFFTNYEESCKSFMRWDLFEEPQVIKVYEEKEW